jgi:hypothetical protein
MRCWLNVHDPPPVGTDPGAVHDAVYLQDKGRHLILDISRGGVVFVYEKKTSPRRVVVEENGQRSALYLQEPREASLPSSGSRETSSRIFVLGIALVVPTGLRWNGTSSL